MKKEKFTTVLSALFIITMVGVIVFAYKNIKSPDEQDIEEENDDSTIISSFSDKLSIRLNEAENKLKSTQSNFNTPAGEFGLFL